MKKLKRVLALTMSAVATLGCMSYIAGCTQRGAGEKIDTTKTQIKVKYNNGGLGRVWIDTVLAKFEEVYAEHSFEEGKKGVQILKDFAKKNVELSAMRKSDSQVFLMEDLDMYDFGLQGALLDITDVVEKGAKTGPQTSEAVTIESKIDDIHKAIYNIPTKDNPDGGYYALPFFDTPINLNYSVDLFESKYLYLKKNGNFINDDGTVGEAFPEYGATADGFTDEDYSNLAKVMNLFVLDTNEERSCGPDGKTGVIDGVDYSVDDGLPATYADFRALLVQMELVGVTPFVWNDRETGYLTSLINGMWANNEGLEQMNLSLTFQGEAKNLVALDKDGNIVYDENGNVVTQAPVEITEANAELIHLQKGKLDALEFAKMVVGKDSKGEYRFNKNSLTQDHHAAQSMFIDYESKGQDKPIAFLIDGEWWMREAYDANFSTIDDMHSRRYGILPLPRATRADVSKPVTNVCDHYSSIFINSNCPANKIDAAKELVSFLQNESSLLTFTYYTNAFRGLEYDISDERLAELGYFSTDPKYASGVKEFGYFTKQVYAVRMADPTYSILPWQPTSDVTRNKTTMLAYRNWGFSAQIGGNSYNNPLICLRANESLSAVDYFKAIYNYWSSNM